MKGQTMKVLALIAVLFGCATLPSDGVEQEKVSVEVRNDSWYDLVVYRECGLSQRRVGFVTAVTRQTIRVEPCQDFAISVRFFSTKRVEITNRFNLAEGQSLVLYASNVLPLQWAVR